jgi:hypothetical protein
VGSAPREACGARTAWSDRSRDASDCGIDFSRTCHVRIRLGIFDAGAAWVSVGGPNVGIGVSRHGVGDKKICFWQKHSPNYNFYDRSTFLSSRNLTGGSGVKGKTGPN